MTNQSMQVQKKLDSTKFGIAAQGAPEFNQMYGFTNEGVGLGVHPFGGNIGLVIQFSKFDHDGDGTRIGKLLDALNDKLNTGSTNAAPLENLGFYDDEHYGRMGNGIAFFDGARLDRLNFGSTARGDTKYGPS